MKAIVFDVDGTLIQSMAVDSELYFASISSVLGPVNIRKHLNQYQNVTDSGILAQIIDDNGILPKHGAVESIRAGLIKRMRHHIESAGPFPVIDGAIQMIERARHAADTGVAIATGGWRDVALLKLDTAGFSIDSIPLASCDDSPSRIEIMRTAVSKLGKDISSVTYFGDAEWDRRACQELGWSFVAVGPELGGIESYETISL